MLVPNSQPIIIGDDLVVEKHMSGLHDQSSHARGSGLYPRVKDKPASRAKVSQEAIDAAIKLRGSYAKGEEIITKKMSDIAAKQGLEMAGLQHRLKSTDSLARKIQADAANEGITIEQAAANISDVQRFTMVADEANYVSTLANVKADLESQGYEVRVKNFWKEGDPYQGVNMKVKKDGKTYELQHHTPTSLSIKEDKIHPIYEEYRDAATLPNRKRELWGAMITLAATIPRPANYDQLLQVPDLVVQTFGS